ncbi:hypothetical protein CERZMDRAFT_53325 [Cercospora zeae-maydis SCOH1-5]|uniref:prephenate dehydratase n=1 Tax=Cercospora zeae-maydis SCOH1-5 TaxID=717836 RepID=A0A6A6EY31_9PEZI|nr:hypothetical protein CERZMDRAFT_53325 [Cercospora zeae-maydis SCOH1-5]
MSETQKPAVAFLGPETSYTHQAALSVFPNDEYDLQWQHSIKEVFDLVQNEKVRYGVVPFENSTNGSVVWTLDLFVNAQNLHPDILVEGEVYLPVHHCLLDQVVLSPDSGSITPTQDTPNPQKPRSKPLQSLAHIKKVYSHPQAWGQCKLFLNTYLKGIEQQDCGSTSRGAELVAADETGTSAAIGSRFTGEVNGLDFLAENIQDAEGNTTRFLIIRNTKDVPLYSSPSSSSSNHFTDNSSQQKFKTLITLTVSHGSPGALADCLAVFKKFGLNLTSINSRPSTESAWHYVFFVECVGRKFPDGAGGEVNHALEELELVAKGWRWLGSWENRLVGGGVEE